MLQETRLLLRQPIVLRTTYDYDITMPAVSWNSRGQHEYLFIYSFELKSVVDICQLF